MTEAEWLVCENIRDMWRCLQGKVSLRKGYLYELASCRMSWQLPVDVVARRIIEEVEQYPEQRLCNLLDDNFANAVISFAEAVVTANLGWAKEAALTREIFGNPFRPVAFNPSWLTSTVVSLARQMYHSHNFTSMPILADALQDAGCDNADILDHCRGPGPHVRGCFVVDFVLGNE